jgi:hypothetical protein|tara:strand:- start:459 stop:659 length:201 start_codon:yes stop_codon:yes gene_type:complete
MAETADEIADRIARAHHAGDAHRFSPVSINGSGRYENDEATCTVCGFRFLIAVRTDVRELLIGGKG